MEKVFDIHTIRLIAGLGNAGDDFTHTRHNSGFMFVEALAKSWNPQIMWSTFKEMETELAVYKSGPDDAFILAKPTTYMNGSGRALTKLMHYYKLKPEQILVAHDDLDLALGDYKLQFGKGPKGHNGISSAEQFLNTKDFWRLRIGIDTREVKGNKGIPGERYALERFKTNEQKQFNKIVEGIISESFSLSA